MAVAVAVALAAADPGSVRAAVAVADEGAAAEAAMEAAAALLPSKPEACSETLAGVGAFAGVGSAREREGG